MSSNRALTAAAAHVRLPHPVAIVAVLVATIALAWAVAGPELSLPLLARMLLAMLGGQILIGVVNEVIDLSLDRATKPDKPLPSGQVSLRSALGLGVAGTLLLIAAGATLGWLSFLLLLVGTGIGVAYSVVFKGTRLAWLPYALALPLLPIWVAVTLDAFDRALLGLFPLGMLGAAAMQLAQALPDVEADRRAGLRTVTTRLGTEGSLILCWALVLVTALLGVAGTIVLGRGVTAMIGAAMGVSLIAAVNVMTTMQMPRRGVLLTFPTAATALGLLAVAWVLAASR